MVRKRTPPKDPDAPKTIAVHPEVYKLLSHQAIDEDRTLREHTNIVLCYALGLEHLIQQAPDPVLA